MSAVDEYRKERLRRGPDVDGLTADAAIAEMEAEVLRSDKAVEDAAAALEICDVALAERDVCGRHCPACVEFTTVFQMPKVEYLGCLRKQSESTKLLNQTAAPIGQPCPYTLAREDSEGCPEAEGNL